MPRKATPKDARVDDEIRFIKDYCARSATSILALSRQARVSQSALERFVLGDRKSVTPTAQKVIDYIKTDKRHKWHKGHRGGNIAVEGKSSLRGNRQIVDAINFLWDGEPQSAELIAAIIRALKPAFRQIAFGTNGGIRRK